MHGDDKIEYSKAYLKVLNMTQNNFLSINIVVKPIDTALNGLWVSETKMIASRWVYGFCEMDPNYTLIFNTQLPHE